MVPSSESGVGGIQPSGGSVGIQSTCGVGGIISTGGVGDIQSSPVSRGGMSGAEDGGCWKHHQSGEFHILLHIFSW